MQVLPGAAVGEGRRVPRPGELRPGKVEEPLWNLRSAKNRQLLCAREGGESDADPDLDGAVEGRRPHVGGETNRVQALLAQRRSRVAADGCHRSRIVESLPREV